MRAVLEFLERNGPAAMPEIARSRSVSRQRIQMPVNSLMAENFVTLERNPGHKRSSLVTMTAAGQKTIRRMRQREARFFDNTEFDLSPNQLKSATRTLRSICATLEQEGHTK